MDIPANILDSYAPPVVSQSGKPLDQRVISVEQARTLWSRMQQDDIVSTKEMAKVQAMVDGQPPLDPARLQKEGLAWQSNFNPGDAKSILDTSLAAFYDLTTGSENLIDVWTNYGDKSERQDLSSRISLHLSRAIRSWPSFPFKFGYLPHYRTLHGVGIGYFPDCENWQWDVTNLAYFKIPRQTPADENEIEYAAMKKWEQPHTLMKYYNLGEAAEEEGWNLKMLKLAVGTCMEQVPDLMNWMEWEARWKNNDLFLGRTATTTGVIYLWVRENDGSYSMFVFLENVPSNLNGEKEEFLCVKRNVFRSATEAFVFFTRGIGTNCTFHGIRGLGSDMFNALQQLMRLRNQQVNAAFASGPTWQVESEEAIENFRIVPYGIGFLATPGATFVQQQPPNITQTLSPAIQDLSQTIANNVGSYTATKTLETGREISKFEAMARLDMTAQLSVTEISMFLQCLDRLFNQVVRRMVRTGYTRGEPGGQYVWEWKERCLEDGIPLEALDKLDLRYTKASRTIGAGSPAARRLSYENLMQLYPYYDDYGKQQLVRSLTGAIAGWDIANQLTTPPGQDQRVSIDAAVADSQNAALAQGFKQIIRPDENRRAHLDTHINNPDTGLMAYYNQFNQAGQNPELYAKIVPPMAEIYDHAAQTLEGYTGTDAPMFRQALQQFDEIIVNGSRHMQKQQAQEAEQQGQQVQDQGPSAIEMKMIEWKAKMDQRAEEFRVKQDMRQREAATKEALKQQAWAAEQSRKAAAAQLQQAQTV